jgi:anti-anti-sigma regulatory factor
MFGGAALEWNYNGASVREDDNALVFRGDFSGVGLIPLRAMLLNYARGFQGDVLRVDLSQVENLEHTGLSILDAINYALRCRGRRMVIASPSPAARTMLATTRLSQAYEIQS